MTWSEDDQLKACNRIYGFDGLERTFWNWNPTLALSAWDIDELAYMTPKMPEFRFPFPYAGSFDGCEGTVAYRGQCYYASQVNYTMWGTMNRLCGESFDQRPHYENAFTLEMAYSAVLMRKELLHQGEDPRDAEPYVRQATAFTCHGYVLTATRGTEARASVGEEIIRPTAVKHCNASASPSLTGPTLRWTWEPKVPRR